MTVSSTSGSSTISFSGLASGLDTTSIINQLMQLESLPQTNLKNMVSQEQLKLSAYQSTSKDVSGLADAASALSTNGAWSAISATSTNAAFSVTASTKATATSFDVTVGNLATATQSRWTQTFALTDALSFSSIDVTTNDANGNPVVKNLDLSGNQTMQGLIKAINDPANATGLTATAVQVSPGQYQLVVTSNATGANSGFTLRQGGDPSSDILSGGSTTAGQDASITVNGITATSSSNTFTGITPGVDLTLTSSLKPGDTTSVTVAYDGSSRAATVSSLIAKLNNVISGIGVTTSYGTMGSNGTFTGGGSLAGDATLRSVAAQLTQTIFSAADSDYTNSGPMMSLLQMGISIDKTGTITFDQDAFNKAYAADPDKVTAAITGTGGFADRIAQVANAATKGVQDSTDPSIWYDGSITGAINSENSLISSLNGRIDDWTDILANKQASLQKQYSALETALSALQTQSSWLTQQLASLPSWGGSSGN